ncbi:MAG: polysaccharide biosynthesis C-terminal domain-containing protein, partial [Candidatus Omnitrophica bacterium]|nr:polysaccharide biosynthesis C-terminal domain-containing protein [Candidatus Omnitrophota bacterium]
PLVDQWAAAPLGAGKLSLFSYADRLLQVPYLLFFYGFTQVFFSFWSDSRIDKEPARFFEKVRKDMRIVFAGAIVLVLIMQAVADPMFRIIFQRSNLTEAQMHQLIDIFRWLALGFPVGILRILYGRILIIIKKSSIYFYQAWLELAVKIVLNFFFAAWFGITGLPMATFVVYSLTTLWFYLYLKRAS